MPSGREVVVVAAVVVEGVRSETGNGEDGGWRLVQGWILYSVSWM